MENLKEMDKFLDNYHLPKLNQYQIDSLNTPITPKEIEAVMSSLQTNKKKAQGQVVLEKNSTRLSKKI